MNEILSIIKLERNSLPRVMLHWVSLISNSSFYPGLLSDRCYSLSMFDGQRACQWVTSQKEALLPACSRAVYPAAVWKQILIRGCVLTTCLEYLGYNDPVASEQHRWSVSKTFYSRSSRIPSSLLVALLLQGPIQKRILFPAHLLPPLAPSVLHSGASGHLSIWVPKVLPSCQQLHISSSLRKPTSTVSHWHLKSYSCTTWRAQSCGVRDPFKMSFLGHCLTPRDNISCCYFY